MRIATRGRFEWNGTRYVFIEEAGYEYSGPIAETKGDKQTQTDANTKQALADSKAKSDAALKSQNSSVNDYKAAIAKVTSRDLYMNPQRQGMVRQAVATNTDAAQKNTEGELSNYAMRTGVNTANIPATIAEGQREAQRGAHDTLVKDQLDQEGKYEQAQQFGAAALGQIPGIYGQNNSSALSYGSSAMSSQASVDAQRVVPQTPWWQTVLQAGAQVGAAAVGKPPCSIAIALWGFDDSRTRLVRAWLGSWRRESRTKELLVASYAHFGEYVAKSPLLPLFRPLFERALGRAVTEAI